MIKINGRKFASNDNEFTTTLFEGNKTAIGYYKKYKRKIMFMDHQKMMIFALVNNHHNEIMFLNCKKQGKGYWYSYLNTTIEKLLGFDLLRYSEVQEIAKSVWNENIQYRRVSVHSHCKSTKYQCLTITTQHKGDDNYE